MFFLIFEGEKREMGNYNELSNKGIIAPKITTLPEEELSLIPEGRPLTIILESQILDFIKAGQGKTKESPDWEDLSYLKMGAKNADFNGDDQVNLHDFMVFRNSYGSLQGEERYNQKIDLNADGRIDLGDFVIMRDYFGKMALSTDWEDQEIIITKTGYKNVDVNSDGKISFEDKNPYIVQTYGDNVLIKERGKDGVYLLKDGVKRPMADKETGDLLGIGFREVKEIPLIDFSQIDEGRPIKLYHDGTLLECEMSYWIILDGERRNIERTSLSFYGLDEKNVVSIDYPELKDIPEGDNMAKYPDGILVKDNQGKYYFIEDGKRRLIEEGLKGIQRMGLEEKKEYTIAINTRSTRSDHITTEPGIIGIMVNGEIVKEWEYRTGMSSSERDKYKISLSLSPGETI